MRTKIKRLLRRHRKKLTKPVGSSARPTDLDYYTDLILGQARDMYRYWPEVGDRLFG